MRWRLVSGWAKPLGVLGVLALASACAQRAVPSPESAAERYASAARSGDADAIYAMMTKSARQSLTRDQVHEIVERERNELRHQGEQLTLPGSQTKATATLRYADGETTTLDYKDDRFWVTSAGTLPAAATTPEQALAQLRRSLARRSYQALMQVLTPQARAAVERDLRSLVEGLEHAETLAVDVQSDVATVDVPGGHHVRLKREAGTWRVDDFD